MHRVERRPHREHGDGQASEHREQDDHSNEDAMAESMHEGHEERQDIGAVDSDDVCDDVFCRGVFTNTTCLHKQNVSKSSSTPVEYILYSQGARRHPTRHMSTSFR